MRAQVSVTNNFQSSDVSNTTQFSIANNAAFFRTIMAGMYQHRVRAVAREIIANAVDAHRMLIAKGVL